MLQENEMTLHLLRDRASLRYVGAALFEIVDDVKIIKQIIYKSIEMEGQKSEMIGQHYGFTMNLLCLKYIDAHSHV